MSFLSRVTYSGVTGTDHSYSVIQLLNDKRVPEQTQLIVTVNAEELAFVASSPAAGEYTLNKATRNVVLGEALVVEDVLVIRRATKRDGLWVVFENNAPLSASDINLVTHQLLFIAQENAEINELNAQFSMSGMLFEVVGGEVVLDVKAPFSYDLTSLSMQTTDAALTLNAKLQVNGVDVTGSLLAADETVKTVNGFTTNRVPAGAKVTLVLEDVSAPTDHDLSFTVRGIKL